MKYKEMKRIIKKERTLYCGKNFLGRVYRFAVQDERYIIGKYLYYLRKEEYYTSNSHVIIAMLYRRKRNVLGNKIHIKIVPFYAGEGINIHHKGIIINGKTGNDVILHGNNCIGNNTMGGHSPEGIPTIGNGVDIGYGANIFGSVTIADNVKIGANTLVIRDITEEGSTWGGVPAHRIN